MVKQMFGRWKPTICARCNDHIDKGACGQAFTIVTIKDDRARTQENYKVKRMYLCDTCTGSLELFLLGEAPL